MTQRRIELCRYLFAEFSVGGGKIKDATAVPSDVASGKTFYNNDGKQVGTGEIIKKYTFPLATGTTTINYHFACYFDGADFYMQSVDSRSATLSNTTISIPDIQCMCGFEYNNIFYPCSVPLKYYYSQTAAIFISVNNMKDLLFTIHDKEIRLGTPLKTGELILYYI